MKAIAVTLSMVLFSQCNKPAAPAAEPEAPPVKVHCVQAQKSVIPDVRVLHGAVAIAPESDALVAPQIAGRLLRVSVREGDSVTPATVVAEVDADVVKDLARQAQAQVSLAQEAVHHGEISLARSRHLFEQGIAPRQEVDDVSAHLVEGRATLNAARAALDTAKRNVERAMVHAPMNGIVLRVMRRTGELVDGTAATAVVEIGDPAGLEFVASASPGDLAVLHAGDKGTGTLNGMTDKEVSLVVSRVAPAIDPTTGVGTVRFALPAAQHGLPIGLSGIVRLTVATHVGITVPPTALQGGESTQVLVCDGEHVKVAEVHVGLRLSDKVEILEGLRAEDFVVRTGVTGIEDGAEIEVEK